MSVVDTWDWDRLKPTEEALEAFGIDANMRVQLALSDFENGFSFRPNRIVMGYRLLNEIVDTFYDKNFTMETLEEAARKNNYRVCCEYHGIPVEIDYDNPNTLEVGCMMSFTHRGK